jgi:hypothetical protein
MSFKRIRIRRASEFATEEPPPKPAPEPTPEPVQENYNEIREEDYRLRAQYIEDRLIRQATITTDRLDGGLRPEVYVERDLLNRSWRIRVRVPEIWSMVTEEMSYTMSSIDIREVLHERVMRHISEHIRAALNSAQVSTLHDRHRR